MSTIELVRQKDGTYAFAKDPGKPEEVAMSDGLAGTKVMGLPVGEALLGGAGAVLFSEVVGGFLPTQPGIMSAVVKGAGAWAAQRFVKGPIGQTAALFLTFDAILELLPVDQWVRGLTQGISKAGASGGGAREEEVAAEDMSLEEMYRTLTR